MINRKLFLILFGFFLIIISSSIVVADYTGFFAGTGFNLGDSSCCCGSGLVVGSVFTIIFIFFFKKRIKQ